jgi:hypothetical protein
MYRFNPGNALELVSQGWDYLRSTVYKEPWIPSNLSSSNPAWSLQFLSDNFSKFFPVDFPKMRAQAVFLISLSALFSNAQEACDAGCQAAFKQLQSSEASSWVSKNVTFDTFYSTPSNSSGAQPGDLLRWEDVPQNVVNRNFTIPGGMSLFRFLYMSEDIDRKPIPASAFALLPYNKPDPNQPFNTTVWATEQPDVSATVPLQTIKICTTSGRARLLWPQLDMQSSLLITLVRARIYHKVSCTRQDIYTLQTSHTV